MNRNKTLSLISTFFYLAALVLVGCATTNEGAPQQEQVEKEPVQQPQQQAQQQQQAEEPQDEAMTVSSPSQPDPQQELSEFEKEMGLREQETHFLAQNYLRTAQKKADEGDYNKAYQFVLEVLKLRPHHPQALELKQSYGERLGFAADEIGERLNETVRLEKVKEAQTELEIRNRISRGKQLASQGEYEEAIELFQQAKELLRWMPHHTTTIKGQAKQIDSLIQRTQQAYELKREELRAKRIAEAQAEAERQERRRLRNLRQKVRNLFHQANLAFEREKYQLAQSYCEEIVTLDPDNQKAHELKRLVQKAHYNKELNQYRDKYKEEWRRTFQKIDDTAVMSQTIVSFPSKERWQEISRRAENTENRLDQSTDPATLKTKAELESQVLSMDFSEAPLTDVVDFLVTTTGINIIIDPAVFKEFPEEESLQVDLTVNKLKLRSILDLILSLKNLAYRIENGVVIISTKNRAGEKPLLHTYDVRDLTGKLPDFPAPEFNLAAANGEEAITGLELIEQDQVNVGAITEEQLTDLIKQNIAKTSWDLPDRSIDTRGGTLIIRQTRTVHEQLQDLLSDLRKSTGLLVTVEVRYLQVEDDFLEDVGVDWRSLGAATPGGGIAEDAEFEAEDGQGNLLLDPAVDLGTTNASDEVEFRELDDIVFDPNTTGNGGGFFFQEGDRFEARKRVENVLNQNFGKADFANTGGLSAQIAYVDDIELQAILRAVRKTNRSNDVDTIRLTVFNTQRANVSILEQRSFIQDFEVEVATNATIADPIIGTLQFGIILDVRPIISADRKYITMELQPTLTADLGSRFVETQLASGNQNNPDTAVSIELPQISMSKIKTTVTIPDGGTLLLGGLAELTRQDFKSGIPFISDIPILTFASTRKGIFSERRNLIILVRAQITSMEEIEPKTGFSR